VSGLSPSLRFGAAALAVWRLTHLVVEEDGPADVVVRVRRRVGDGIVGSAMDCFYCSSVWAAAACAPAVTRRPRELPLAVLALSGAACLLERATTKGEDDELLWTQAQAGGQGGEADDREPRIGADAAGRRRAGDGAEARDAAGDGAVTRAR
jgi:hypothetical protein